MFSLLCLEQPCEQLQQCQDVMLTKVSQGCGAAMGVQVKCEVLGNPSCTSIPGTETRQAGIPVSIACTVKAFGPASTPEHRFTNEKAQAHPRSLRGGPGSGQESVGEGFSLVLDFKQAFDLKAVPAALGLNSPCGVGGLPRALRQLPARIPQQPCLSPSLSSLRAWSQWPSLWVEDESGPHAGRAGEGGGGSDPPIAAGGLKQSVYHGKIALCSNSNGNFPE